MKIKQSSRWLRCPGHLSWKDALGGPAAQSAWKGTTLFYKMKPLGISPPTGHFSGPPWNTVAVLPLFSSNQQE